MGENTRTRIFPISSKDSNVNCTWTREIESFSKYTDGVLKSKLTKSRIGILYRLKKIKIESGDSLFFV